MFLSTKDGISCDHCGSVHRKKFTYYSLEWEKIVVDANKGTINKKMADSTDMCDQCYNIWMEKCNKNIGEYRKHAVKCDMCPKYMQGAFDYYRVLFTEVTVDSEQKKEGPLEVKKNAMDLNIGSGCRNDIFKKVAEVKESTKQKGGWS
jgi:hypothetical protein